ncbi:MAG: hypothetical protein AB8H03_08140 [Saprospiraceae bacterium]
MPLIKNINKNEPNRKKRNKNHTGRNKIPDHLPTCEVIIEPEEDTTGMKKIGKEITKTLALNEVFFVSFFAINWYNM